VGYQRLEFAAIEVLDSIDILESNEDGRSWIIPGLLPLGSAICFAAGGGTGKTSLVYNLAKHIALGRAWSGYPVKQGKVLIIQTDEPTVDIRDKLDIANYFEVPRGLVKFITKWRFSQIRQLEAIIAKHEPSLIVIDSYTAAHAGMNTELSKSSAGDSLYKLRDIANAKGCSFVVIHHMNKMDGLRDSSTIKDNVSEVWMMTRDEQHCSGEHQLVLEISKSRAGIAGQYLMERNPVDYSWTHLGRVDGHQTHLKRVVSELKKLAPRTFSARQLSERTRMDYREAEESLELGRRMGLLEGKWAQYTRNDGTPDRFRVYGYSLTVTEGEGGDSPAIEAELPERKTVDFYGF
jgi:AAA domain